VNFSLQYIEKVVTIVFKTMLVLVKSVPVHSMKTFLVLREILEWSPLIIGGKDKTVLSLS